MQSTSPVWTESEVDLEQVIALDQEQYQPIIILPTVFADGVVGSSVRFQFTDEERAAIAAGADLVVIELTFGRPFTPLALYLCQPGEAPR